MRNLTFGISEERKQEVLAAVRALMARGEFSLATLTPQQKAKFYRMVMDFYSLPKSEIHAQREIFRMNDKKKGEDKDYEKLLEIMAFENRNPGAGILYIKSFSDDNDVSQMYLVVSTDATYADEKGREKEGYSGAVYVHGKDHPEAYKHCVTMLKMLKRSTY